MLRIVATIATLLLGFLAPAHAQTELKAGTVTGIDQVGLPIARPCAAA